MHFQDNHIKISDRFLCFQDFVSMYILHTCYNSHSLMPTGGGGGGEGDASVREQKVNGTNSKFRARLLAEERNQTKVDYSTVTVSYAHSDTVSCFSEFVACIY